MKTVERILLATDFSGSSDEAVNWAIDIGKKFKSEVVLLHVISNDYDLSLVTNMVRKAATDQLSIIRDRFALADVKTTQPIIRIGKTCDVIVQVSEEKDVNLIVMGSGEKGSEDRFQLGTTTEKVIRKADKPVWVAKKDCGDRIAKILCPVDFSDSSRRALDNAIHLSRKFKAHLYVLNIVAPVPVDIARLKIDVETVEQSVATEQLAAFEKFFDDFEFTGVEWSSMDRMGDPAHEILRCIDEVDADLLIMGTHGRKGINRFFMGSVTEKVIREVPCSFITTKTEDIIQLRVNTDISSIKIHYKNGVDLMKEGFLKESVQQLKACLKINDLHIPAWKKLAEVYELQGDFEKAEVANAMSQSIRQKLWDQQTEVEIRGKSSLFGKKTKQF